MTHDLQTTTARKLRGRLFGEGNPGNSHGRPKGVPNKVTAEAKAACNELVDDLAYRAALRKRLIAGKLAPAAECMLWWYGKRQTDRPPRCGRRPDPRRPGPSLLPTSRRARVADVADLDPGGSRGQPGRRGPASAMG